MTFKKIPLKGGLEYDVLTGWRKYLCYTGKPGICKYVKNKYNRRMRQHGKKRIQVALDEIYGNM